MQGPGILYFARYNHWHGSPWHYEVDGTDHVVTRDAAPPTRNHPKPNSVFLPHEALPEAAGLDLVADHAAPT